MALTPHHTHMVLTKRPERMRSYATSFSKGHNYCSDHICRILAPIEGGGYDTALAKDREFLRSAIARCGGSPTNPKVLRNLMLGVSVEDQQRADERIPLLLDIPAALRFVSCEPLLGPVDLKLISPKMFAMLAPLEQSHISNIVKAVGRPVEIVSREVWPLDWVIVGGESGQGARPLHPDWARSLRDQCAAAGTAFHFKQWGCLLYTSPSPRD